MRSLLLSSAIIFFGVALPVAPQDLGAPRFEDPAWLKEAADALARCVGTYRGAAFVMREGGREQAATYLEDTARGALVSAQFLLTARAALEDKVLYQEDSAAYVEGVAGGSEGFFKALAEASESQAVVAEELERCTKLNPLQSTIVQTIRESMTLERTPELTRSRD